MQTNTTLGISFKYESRILFRNVQPVNEILDDLNEKKILHIHIDPDDMKYGSWDLVIAFAEQQNYERFKAGELSASDLWQSNDSSEQHRVNPLKAAKRAAAAAAG